MAKDAKRLGDLLQAILPEGTQNIHSILQMGRSWRSLVGDELAGYSKIYLIENHVLTVDISHPGFMQLLQMKQHRILKKIQKDFPELEVKRIRIRLVENLKTAPRPFQAPKESELEKQAPDSFPSSTKNKNLAEEKPQEEGSKEMTIGEKFRQEMEKLLD